ncbi:Uncharacterised protein [Serratia fonticola]|uniref:Uncharacterized protein n=1 Tax=Serratia fonticola TaxID=47917 RepID=A0A4U9U0J7_SERFO|nr:Uncharacterised protein [Serratia fonticola]
MSWQKNAQSDAYLVEPQSGAATRHRAVRRIQRLLWGFLIGPHAFQLFIHHGTDLRHIAQTQPFVNANGGLFSIWRVATSALGFCRRSPAAWSFHRRQW